MVRLTRQGEFVMPRIALLVVAFLAASSAQAQVHKCVDAAGKIIYTQTPAPRHRRICGPAPARSMRREMRRQAARFEA